MKPTSTIRLSAAVALAVCSDPSSAFQPSTTAFTPRISHPSSSTWKNPAITTPTSRNRKSSTTQRNVVMVEDPTMVTSGLDAFFQSQPYLAAFLTCSVKAGTADLLAQKQALSGAGAAAAAAPPSPETRDNKQETAFDLPRNLSFVFYGGLVQGMFQQFLFSVIYPIMFGHDHTFFTTLQQVAFDVGVMPFVYLPIVYTIKSLFSASSMAKNTNNFSLETVQDGLAKLGDDILNKGLLKTYWSIWIPAQSLTFSVVPPHLRVLFVALVSFCWVTILSSISSSASSTSTSTASPALAADKDASSPSLSSSAEGLMEALQRGADALQHESNKRAALPSQGPTRRPAYVAVAVNAASASQPSMDGARDRGASYSSQYRQ